MPSSKAYRVIFVLFLFNIAQFFLTACDLSGGGESGTYSKSYHSLSVQAWDTSGFQSILASDSVTKVAFGLTINVNFDLEEVAINELHLSSFGFSSVMADPVPPEYINIDPMESLEIIATDKQSGLDYVVTDNFVSYNFAGNQMTIAELFDNLEEWQDGFQLDLNSSENIFTRTVFAINIQLESGKILTTDTEEILFKD